VYWEGIADGGLGGVSKQHDSNNNQKLLLLWTRECSAEIAEVWLKLQISPVKPIEASSM
jgi:hypothetical protein